MNLKKKKKKKKKKKIKFYKFIISGFVNIT